MHIQYEDILAEYKKEVGTKSMTKKHEKKLKRVFMAIYVMQDMPASMENVREARKLAHRAITQMLQEDSGWFGAGILGFVNGVGEKLEDAVVKDKASLYKDPFYWMQFMNITNDDAKEAIFRGNSTIGNLFILQPSIFAGD